MKSKWFFRIMVALGVILFAVLAVVIVQSTATTTAIVPNQTIAAGTTITQDMLTAIQVPVDTPEGYITDVRSLVGQKIRTSAAPNQLLYPNNFLSTWDDLANGKEIPEDYIITAIQIPEQRAVGGLITAGEYVDILGIPNAGATPEDMQLLLGPAAQYGYGTPYGNNLYWILANVLILETNSNLAEANNSSISGIVGNNGMYYIVALSYDDYEKLLYCNQYMDFWMNIVPEQNSTNGPMLDEMRYAYLPPLHDTMNQSKFDGEGNRLLPEKTQEEWENAYIADPNAEGDVSGEGVTPEVTDSNAEVEGEEVTEGGVPAEGSEDNS